MDSVNWQSEHILLDSDHCVTISGFFLGVGVRIRSLDCFRGERVKNVILVPRSWLGLSGTLFERTGCVVRWRGLIVGDLLSFVSQGAGFF